MNWLFAALAASLATGAPDPLTALQPGLVVEEVMPSVAAHVGIQPGDVILTWSRKAAGPLNPAARGDLLTPFDLTDVEVEELPRGPVHLDGRRGFEAMSWAFPPVRFGLVVGPRLQGALLSSYEENRRLASTNPSEAAAGWRAAAEEMSRAGQPRLGIWLFSKAGRTLADARQWSEAETTFEAALALAERSHDTRAEIDVLSERGEILRRRRQWAACEESMRRMVALERVETLSLASNLNHLGLCTWWVRQEPTVGIEEWERSFRITERLAPESLQMARSWTYRGIGAAHQGDLAAAEAHQRRSVEVLERLAPGDKFMASMLLNLGLTLVRRGDLASAEDVFRRALAIAEQTPGDEGMLAEILSGIGRNATLRFDYAMSEHYYKRVLAIYEKLAPESQAAAAALNNLGIAAHERGDTAAGDDYFRRSLAIKEKIAPYSLGTAISLSNIGRHAVVAGDLPTGEAHLRRVLEILEKAGRSDSVDAAGARGYLAMAARKRGDIEAAEEHIRTAVAMMSRLAPGTSEEAHVLHEYGLIEYAGGRREAAAEHFLRAVDALESQRQRLGGTMEAASNFIAEGKNFYHNAMTTMVELHREPEALHLLERSRARLWLARMAERDLPFSSDLPVDLARERKRVDLEYDTVEDEIARLDPVKDDGEVSRRRARLKELREAQDQIVARITKASPRLASLQYPKPLDLAGVQAALDPGTTLLAYSVGEEDTLLFVVSAPRTSDPGLAVVSLPVGAKALRDKVEMLRATIAPAARASNEALVDQAAALYELLIRPVEARIDESRRILISPDGPLHSLPFAALARRDAGTAQASYLIERKPLHVVPSVTVYAQLHKSPHGDRVPGGKLVAFGDPVYSVPGRGPVASSAESALRSMTQGGLLAPLPAARDEVLGIAGYFKGAAEVHVGAEATEERAKAVDPKARYVHFACHAFLDEHFPLNSGLILTLPEAVREGDNGLLQAWEVFDHVRIDADLVTLSGCHTAQGTEMGGEGLLGLTRAFHHAGARAVLASLWAVSDKSTARLMKSFYGHLAAGQSLDESLQAAQVELIHQTRVKGAQARWSRPFYWAAFQLSGDWR